MPLLFELALKNQHVETHNDLSVTKTNHLFHYSILIRRMKFLAVFGVNNEHFKDLKTNEMSV